MSQTRKPDQGAAKPTPTTDPTADQDGTTRRQRNEATGEKPPGDEPPYQRLKRPDERDESTERDSSHQRDESGTRPLMQQGARDLEQGREDTDCYDAAGRRYQRHREREQRDDDDARDNPPAEPAGPPGPGRRSDPHRR